MTTIQGTTSVTAASATTASNPNSTASTQDRFLTLLVTQLQNQDPLNPMDNAQLTTQLAQISTVDGINKINDTLTGLASAMTANQSLQAIGLVGHNVSVPGTALGLASGKATGGVNLAAKADDVVVTIKDAAGKTVRSLDLGAKAAGLSTFSWDGKTDAGATAADGTYTISVTATASGAAVTADPMAYGTVTGVGAGANGVQVTLGSLGAFDLSAITQVN